MQIERLRLVNFRQHEDTEIVFGAGLTGIIGPNGSGKTTLLEAIADRKSTRLNSSHIQKSRMPSSA